MRPCVAWRKLTGTSDGRKGGQRNGLEAGPGELENWVVMLPPGNRSTALQLFGSSGVRSTTTQEPTSSPLPALATDDELAEQGAMEPSCSGVRDSFHDLDGGRAAVRQRIGGLLAGFLAHDRGAERRAR